MENKIRKERITMIRNYVKSWLDADKEKFLLVLSEDVFIRECYGAERKGREESGKWFEEWNGGENTVISWKILNEFYDEKKDTVFINWDFRCKYMGEVSEFLGSSIAEFKNDKIYRLYEYEMKK